MVDLHFNPMEGGFAYRRELLAEIPFRHLRFFDWAHFCELSYFGKTVDYSAKPRTVFVRRDISLSLNNVEQSHQEIHKFQEQLRNGLIRKGEE